MRQIALAALLVASSPVLADEPNYMPTSATAQEFAEWNAFLDANPLHYNTRPLIVPLTDEFKSLTKRINVEVNRAPYRDDGPRGDEDVWTLLGPDGGDCEDYVLTKRDQLIRAGIPAAAMLPAILARPNDPDGHMVLVLITDQGDFVMDNLTDYIAPWRESRSNGWVFISRLFGGTTWQIIDDR